MKKKSEESFVPKNMTLFEYCDMVMSFVKEKEENMFGYDYEKGDYVNKFLVANHFEKRVPEEWREVLLNCSYEDLIHLANVDNFTKSDFPESLKKFKYFCDTFQLSNVDQQKETFKIEHPLKFQCKPKKVHELERLMKVVVDFIEENDIKVVFDLGCGKGYLTSLIAHYFPNIDIVGIDNNTDQIERFENRKRAMEKVGEKKELSNMKLMVQHLELDHLEELDPYLQKGNALILALHACGDLSPFCMKVYTYSPKIVGLINVSCCYFKLTKGNFPISKYYRERIQNYDTKNLAIACFACKTWKVSNSIPQFRFRSYRFAFESLLFDRNVKKGKMSKYNGRRVPKKTETFAQYSRWSFGQLIENYPKMKNEFQKILDEPDFEEKVEKFYQSFHPDKNGVIQKVAVFWCLRGLFSPIIETQVLLDRYVYLLEQENVKEVNIRRIFDSSVSPRNILLLSKKYIKKEQKNQE